MVFNNFKVKKFIKKMLITCILLTLCFFTDNVYAADYGYSSGTYTAGFGGCSTSGTNCVWKQWGSQVNYGERIVMPDLDGMTIGSRLSIRVYGGDNYTYKKNNTYHFRYTFSTTSNNFNTMSFWYLYGVNGNTTSSTSGQTRLDFESNTIGYKIVKNNTGDNYFDVVISISPSQDYKYFNFYLSIPIAENIISGSEYSNALLSYGFYENIQLRKLVVTYSEGVGSQIDNQTTIINNNFNETNNNINKVDDSINDMKDEIMGPDTKYDSVDDSGLDSYKKNEDALINKDSLNNINNIQMSVDYDTNLFIWDVVNRVLNSHALIFNMVITFLSIGVIKLILNR